MSQADWRPKEIINDTPSLGRMDMTNLDHNKRLRRATVALAAFLAMTVAAGAQTSKPDTDTTKKFEAAQKVETTPAKGQ
jgi:hypothetical protein